jgi:hypothetical protein
MKTITDTIEVLQAKINAEHDPVKKQNLQRDLIKHQLRLQIEKLQQRIEDMG